MTYVCWIVICLLLFFVNFQLKYYEADSLGPCLSVYYPENNNPVTLPVAAVSTTCCVTELQGNVETAGDGDTTSVKQ